MNNQNISNAARAYAALGWAIFPLHTIDENGNCSCGKPACKNAGKHPRTIDGVKSATADLIKIEEWFGENAPAANIGLATGKISGITIYDIDIGEGKNGAETWRAALGENGEPATLMAITGSGGMHVFFKYNSALKTCIDALGKGVDIRNDGGYVVAPPSAHKSGRFYEWINWGEKIDDVPAVLSRFAKKKKNQPRRAQKFTIDEARRMLEFVDGTSRESWRNVGVILGREFNRSDEAWELYVEWAERDCKEKGRNHDKIMREAFYEVSAQSADKQLTMATIIAEANENGYVREQEGRLKVDDFIFFAPDSTYIYLRNGSVWTTDKAVDAAIGEKAASAAVRKNNLCTGKICEPSLNTNFIRNKINRDGELCDSLGDAVYNIYRPPTLQWEKGYNLDAVENYFIAHLKNLFRADGDVDQFLDYMAHRVQKPWEKPRFALVLGGGQGTGKDSAVEWCIPAIGSHNVASISPKDLSGVFNDFATKALVRINEAANLQDTNKWEFNEMLKVLIAGSPDVCTINPKYGKQFQHKMFCGVIITTNHLASGLYIPSDDRRYDVLETATLHEMGLDDEKVKKAYFDKMWSWVLNKGEDGFTGKMHIAAFLHLRNISKFSAALGQRKTAAHRRIVSLGLAGDQWLDDILHELGNPPLIRGDQIFAKAVENGEQAGAIKARMSSTLDRCDYVILQNPNRKDNRWVIKGKRTAVYIKRGLPPPDNIEFALENCEQF